MTSEESKESAGYDHDFRIIDYITRNPGCNKEQVIRGTGDLSRVPTHNRLTNLIKLGVIRTEAKGAKYRNKLYVTEKDPYSRACTQINTFEREYFILLDKVTTLIKNGDSKIWAKFKKNMGMNPPNKI